MRRFNPTRFIRRHDTELSSTVSAAADIVGSTCDNPMTASVDEVSGHQYRKTTAMTSKYGFHRKGIRNKK